MTRSMLSFPLWSERQTQGPLSKRRIESELESGEEISEGEEPAEITIAVSASILLQNVYGVRHDEIKPGDYVTSFRQNGRVRFHMLRMKQFLSRVPDYAAYRYTALPYRLMCCNLRVSINGTVHAVQFIEQVHSIRWSSIDNDTRSR